MSKKTRKDLFEDYMLQYHPSLCIPLNKEQQQLYWKFKDVFDLAYSLGKEDGIREVCNGVDDIILS